MPPASTIAIPNRNTRRGPNSSASRPAVGWAIALVRYRPEMRIDVLPTATPMAAAIGTNAVAIAELLIGFSAEPRYNGVTNRDPNRFPSAAPLAGGCVLLLVVLVALSACTD